ncbi:ATP-dependent DNA helicase RuvA [Labrenzia sp. CP4]|jgi:Holliday junction DNA helicase RuvA|uniref:Holliday junction branch migration protein RuvA n=1 Tax=unclassified Labrenzia TaxID=2648686 RepID=UPI000783C87A|nr:MULTISPECIES: Holliday junction branch migration protein RuvA [unclassified Labrenzia]AMN51861.1 ATP-dependent DNA helicase RuvA [Labrenzia sp. CP4]NKX64853.1 Holliday junction branch migration protein RuvA [Labrenzia sp. 5N]QFS97942.1 Holliday junction ATP-dependent DNA helicase RuvA [Labrenzia sp. THAF191b]QFT04257.1 Holliday junction ATP-dependent DNA helicase RuvA [Labrenzia sp. THAF191a]QFT15800.1 Holliday junction ATP-dependent DNA helicase RuvA [Labrenzia sp. THAF187b]
MIGKLKGTIDSYGEDHVILDVHGVGYQVHCPSRILQGLPRAGEAAVLFIETIVREDMIRLYGFGVEAEREWFRILMTVQGVGAKVALGILGILKASEVANAIALGDKATISRAPGVGKRVAERIIAELKDKAPGLATVDQGTIAVSQNVADNVAARPVAEAVSALTNLGYAQAQASGAVAKALQSVGEDATTETLIRLGLKELAG